MLFDELSSGKCVPRTVLLDLEPSSINEITAGDYGKLFHPDNMVYVENGPGMNVLR